LNVWIRPAEVLAVELRQYQREALRTPPPIMLSETQGVITQELGVSMAKGRCQPSSFGLAEIDAIEGASGVAPAR
jgi:hypothetical protein